MCSANWQLIYYFQKSVLEHTHNAIHLTFKLTITAYCSRQEHPSPSFSHLSLSPPKDSFDWSVQRSLSYWKTPSYVELQSSSSPLPLLLTVFFWEAQGPADDQQVHPLQAAEAELVG